MTTAGALKESVCQSIEENRDRIIGVGEAIMDDPELGFKEHRTAEKVQEVFSDLGLEFDSGLGLTGVKAVLRGGRPGPTVALMGELDALQVPGHPRANPDTQAAHACGHNAQIAGLMGAAVGLRTSGIAQELAGNIVFLAVPAEEYVEIDYRLGLVREGKTSFLCGKQELIKLGHFDDVDMAVMIHTKSPAREDGTHGVGISSNGFLAKTVTFRGVAAHAGGAPEQGVNALYAAQLALAGINSHRETFRDEDCVRVHPIITKGGDLVNVIPSEVRLETYVRAKTAEAIRDAASRVDACLKGAAMAMRCRVEIDTVPGNLPLNNDPNLRDLFRRNAATLFEEDGYRDYPHGGGSTDAGDLSQLMPVLHPVMAGAHGEPHSVDWHIADTANGYVSPAKTLAMMAVDLLADDAGTGRQVLEDFTPGMSRDEYLSVQEDVFRTEVFDGEA
ncbi:MAG: amidohydrolase [Planctomycetaceae bacterium]|nr:amidohydrolase [Planctomycetales bacterium]GIS60448.1 MAG: amidohydrolase [Planctomycetaceae bacterium]